MSAYQWTDVLEGEPPLSLRDLPCDHWLPGEGPEVGTKALLCIDCGWYRIIPNGNFEAATVLRGAVDSHIDGWNNAMEAPEDWSDDA